MRFADPIRSVEYVIRQVGQIKVEQLLWFFRGEYKSDSVKACVNLLVKRGVIDYDVDRSIVTPHNIRKCYKQEYLTRRMEAFWTLAYFGSNAVLEFKPIGYFLVFEVILSTDNTEKPVMVYDVSVCNTKQEAGIASREIRSRQFENEPDDVVHLVVVPDEDIGERMVNYEFDSFIVLREMQSPNGQYSYLSPEFGFWEG